MADPATTRLANTVGYVYEDDDAYTRFEDEEGRDMVTDAYDATKTYAEGALCINDNKLYKAASAIETAEVWTPDHWTQTDINTELSSLNTKTTSISNNLSTLSSTVSGMKNTYCHVCNGSYNRQLTKNTEITLATYTAPSDGAYFLSGVIQYDNGGDNKMNVRNYVCNALNKANYWGETYMGGRGTIAGRYMLSNSTIVTAKAGEPLVLLAYVTEDYMHCLSYVFDVIKLI